MQGSRDRSALLFGVAVAGAIAVSALSAVSCGEPQAPVSMYGGPPAHDIAPTASTSAAPPDQAPPAVDAGAIATPTPTPAPIVDAGVTSEDAGHHGHVVKAPVVMYGAPPSH